VLFGRFLGFHLTFGPPRGVASALMCGVWQAPGLQILIDLRTEKDDGVNVEALERAMASVAQSSRGGAAASRVRGLCVVTPTFLDRQALEASASAAAGPIGIVSIAALVSVASLVASGQVTHEEILRLFALNVPFGQMLELVGRCAASEAPRRQATAAPLVASTGFWILTVAGDRGTTADEFLEVVVGRRHVLGLAGDRPSNDAVRAGDRICFHIAGRGVVGHGRIAAQEQAAAGLRDAHRFRTLWRLEDVRLYVSTPVAIDVETDLRLRAAHDPGGQSVVSVSRESFDGMTSGAPPAGTSDPQAPRLVG